jgi:hypothetical protein
MTPITEISADALAREFYDLVMVKRDPDAWRDGVVGLVAHLESVGYSASVRLDDDDGNPFVHLDDISIVDIPQKVLADGFDFALQYHLNRIHRQHGGLN